MGIRITLDLGDSLTYEDLFRFVDHVRAAEVDSNSQVTIESEDEIGNPLDVPALVADLGDVDELSRPAMWLSARDLDRYITALEREMAHEANKNDDEIVMELLRSMWDAARENL